MGAVPARTTLPTVLNQAIFKCDDRTRVEARHVLRALLRQATYLPDKAARHYFHQYIIARYRKYLTPPSVPPSWTLKRQSSILKEARKGLRFLARANDGGLSHLSKVLAMTYGRTGKRKYELLQDVIRLNVPEAAKPEILSNEEAVSQLSTARNVEVKNSMLLERSLDPKEPKSSDGPGLRGPLRALVKSQRNQKSSMFDGAAIGNADPKIPKLNSWGRSMPLKRVENMTKKWYADILDKAMPPLPEREWDRLRDLALGRIPCEAQLRRRTLIAPQQNLSTNRVISNQSAEPSWKPRQANSEEGMTPITNQHHITPRSMRRLWLKIFLQCPKMNWDEERMRWAVTWGDMQRSKEIVLANSADVDVSFFEGVNEKGKVT